MLWKHYVYRRGPDVHGMWDWLFDARPVRLLYIAGRGFDVRAQSALAECTRNLGQAGVKVEAAKLLLVGFKGYQLSDDLHELTAQNASALKKLFAPIGDCHDVTVEESVNGEDDASPSNVLRRATEEVLGFAHGYTDIIVDISSMPRVSYLSLITGLLSKLVPDKSKPGCLTAGGVNLQVLVAENPNEDARIKSEEPSNDLTTIPGFSSALYAETVQDWPCVWFPILGENRVSQLQKVLMSVPDAAEICPVLPHPSRDPRRGDRLLIEYKGPLFDSRQTPTGNIIYVHESNPFEAYRQLLGAMKRYQGSMQILGGCRLVVTPLGSKLVTVGAGLACFEMRPASLDENYAVAIPYSGSTKYVAETQVPHRPASELVALLLTGSAYATPEPS